MDIEAKDIAMFLGIMATGTGLVTSGIKGAKARNDRDVEAAKAAGAREEREKEISNDLDGLGTKITTAFHKIDCNKDKIQEQEVKHGRVEEILKSLDSKLDTVLSIVNKK